MTTTIIPALDCPLNGFDLEWMARDSGEIPRPYYAMGCSLSNGRFVFDGSGNGRACKASNGLGLTSGLRGPVYDFADASSNDVIVPSWGIPAMTRWCWSFWIKIRSDGHGTVYGRVVNTETVTDHIWTESGFIKCRVSGGLTTKLLLFAYATDTLYHVVFQGAGDGTGAGKTQLWINGNMEDDDFGRSWPAYGQSVFRIGNSVAESRSMDGELDNLCLIPDYLSPERIRSIWSSQPQGGLGCLAQSTRLNVLASGVEPGTDPHEEIFPFLGIV